MGFWSGGLSWKLLGLGGLFDFFFFFFWMDGWMDVWMDAMDGWMDGLDE